MRVIFDVGHPGHVHLFKNAIWQLERRGYEILVTARDKDIAIPLLEAYGFEYEYLSKAGKGMFGLLVELVRRDWRLLGITRRFQPDVLVGIGDSITHVGCVTGKPSIVFTDSEPVPIDRFLTYPFASVICTPDCFMRDLGKRHIRYAGYHELAYLHPDYFQPDPTVLDDLGVLPGEPFILLRFVGWKASHDLGHRGLSHEVKRESVKTLGRYGRVFITSERPLPDEFEPYRSSVPLHRVHDVLYYARLFMGDGATMATEAGIIGTPAVRCSSLALSMGNFVELMDRYELVYSYHDPAEALRQAVRFLEQEDVKEEWARRRERMLADKIDVTAFICDMVERYVG